MCRIMEEMLEENAREVAEQVTKQITEEVTKKVKEDTAGKLLGLGVLSDEQICKVTRLSPDRLKELKAQLH